MMQIEDLTLIKLLGRGSCGEVYLSKKRGKNEYFATKKIDRITADQENTKKYLLNEINILKQLNHPNIIKYEDIKKTKDYYYIVTEYCNGGNLSTFLEKYIKKYGKAFSEEIVQYLMKQIVSAIKYFHDRNIIHRDLKLENIMINFDIINNKVNSDIMKAKIKIIDFGFSIILNKGKLAQTAIGTFQNMAPLILNKFLKKKNSNLIGYDKTVDIWSLGTICYEMLIGHPTFDTKSFEKLREKVEKGIYKIPTTLSKEVVSFLNGMLQYNEEDRLNINELSNHPFLIKNINFFTKINLSNRMKNKEININSKNNNETIWAIFNEEDEKILINIDGKSDTPNEPIIKEEYKNKNFIDKENNNNIIIGNIHGQKTFQNNQNLNDINRNRINQQKKNNYPTFYLPKINQNFEIKRVDSGTNQNNYNPPITYNNNIPTNRSNNDYYNPLNNEDDGEKSKGCCCQ